jgi:hypothetical protein
MKSTIAKTCVVCGEIFYPERRVEKRQQVCDKLACKLEKKRQSQQRWLAQNPDYFKGRYPQLKEQILANKRKKSSAKIPRTSGIQDELTAYNNSLLMQLLCIQRIQDEITSKITKSKLHLKNLLNLVYKTN